MQVTVTQAQIAAALELVGLPAAASARPVGAVWVHGNFEITLVDGRRLLLRCVRENPGWDTLLNEATALPMARQVVPVVDSYAVLPRRIFGRPAALSTFVDGIDGGADTSDPAIRAQLAAHVGGSIAKLSTLRFDAHGTVGTGGRFVPRAPSWRDEWELLVEEAWARAVSAGLDLGALGPAVLQRVREGMSALDGVRSFTLVHRDLHPNNLRLRTDGSLAAVIDWSDALIGDPQVEWASLCDAPSTHFQAIHQAAGSPPLDRLPLYDASRTVQRLGFAALPLFDGDGGRLRAAALENARRACARVLGAPISPVEERDVAVRRTLDAMRFVPGVRPHLAGGWASALAASLLGPPWDTWVDDLLEPVTRDHVVRPAGRGSLEQATERVLSALPEKPQGALSLVAVALARQGDHALDHTAGDRVWAGMAELVEGLIRLESELELGDEELAVNALLGRAACTVLEAPSLASRFGPPLAVDAAEAKLAARRDGPSGPSDAMLPLVAWALDVNA